MGMILGTRARLVAMFRHVKVWFSENGPMQAGGCTLQASPLWDSVWCSPAGGFFFFSRKNTFLVFCNLKQCSCILPEQYLTGLGYIDAHWKVSALDFNMVPNWWPENSEFEIKHGSVNHLPKSPVNHKTWLTAFSAWLTQGPSTIKHPSTITIPESVHCIKNENTD